MMPVAQTILYVDLSLLREETRAQHEATETLLPLATAQLTPEQYGQVLQCYYRFVQGWESWAVAHAPLSLKTLVDERQRGPLLLRDLKFLKLAAPADAEDQQAPLFSMLLASGDRQSPKYEAAFLGAMYVMEGSTLGGQYIARHVDEILGLQPGEGDAYFRGYGEQTGAMWNAFRQVLAEVPDEYSSLVIASAKAAFRYVQDVMRGCPAALGPSTSAS